MKSYPVTQVSLNHSQRTEKTTMFAFLKKHAVAFTIGTAVLIATALGFTWFKPGVVGGAIKAIGNAVTGFGSSVIGFFRRAPSPVDVAAAGMGTPTPTAA